MNMSTNGLRLLNNLKAMTTRAPNACVWLVLAQARQQERPIAVDYEACVAPTLQCINRDSKSKRRLYVMFNKLQWVTVVEISIAIPEPWGRRAWPM